MNKLIISLVIVTLAFLSLQPFVIAYASIDQDNFIDTQIRDLVTGDNARFNKLNENGVPVVKNAYYVTLKNETFDSINNDPKFDNSNQFIPSAIPQRNNQVIPALQHEYIVKTGKIIYDKVEEYNGTATSSLSPLKAQGGYVDTVYSYVTKGFMVKDVKDISVFVNDPDIALVEEVPIPVQTAQYMPYNAMRLGHGKQAALSVRPDGVEDFPNVDIAVIDSPILRTHPDLNIVQNKCNYLPSNIICYPPKSSHGTEAAGIATARDNLAGVSGPAAGAKIWSYAICGHTSDNKDSCSGDFIGIINNIAANAATIDVATASLTLTCGWRCTESTTHASSNSAINNLVSAGVVFVTGAGNDDTDADNKSFCNASSALCVSAMADMDGKCGGLAASYGPFTAHGSTFTQRDDERAYFSNYGDSVDFMASGWAFTGGASLSTSSIVTQTNIDNNNRVWPFIGASIHGAYDPMGGTSEATPWVAGAAAALKSLHPSWTPAQIKSDLQANDIPQEASCNTSTGIGGLRYGANSRSSEDILNLAAID